MQDTTKAAISIFIFLFIVSYVAINWIDVSWLFNYKEMSGLVYDFFNPYQDSALVLVKSNTAETKIGSDPVVTLASVQNTTLQIPAISLTTPVIISQTNDAVALEKDLDNGAVYYPGSVLPGQPGQMVILGHSAPPNWPPIKHDWIFSKIENLGVGDTIILTFNNKTYTYKVLGKDIIQQGQDLKPNALSATKNVLTLISCWPPGKNYQRIAVTAVLQV